MSWRHSLLSLKNTGSQVPDWRFDLLVSTGSEFCMRKNIFFDEDRRNLFSQWLAVRKGKNTSHTEESIVLNTVGQRKSAMKVTALKTMEPGDTGSGFYSSWQGPTTREVRLYHGQRGRPSTRLVVH